MPDLPPEAAALARFLTAAPADRPALAPTVAEAVGAERLEEVVQATLERIGGFEAVEDSPDGLLLRGGGTDRVRAWAATTPDGELTGLLFENVPYTPTPPVRRLPAPLTWAFILLPVALWIVLPLWGADDRLTWLGDLSVLAALLVLAGGWGTPAQQPRTSRRLVVTAAVTAALASAVRLPDLPTGSPGVPLVLGTGLLLGAVALVTYARRYRWGTTLSTPLRFPLDGTWYVLQGGGALINHHARIPEQRGAVDLVGIGPLGTRTGPGPDAPAYAAYGRAVHAPCDGRVVSAACSIDDQKPGEIRYQPLYGNHVFLDTGHEIVKLAHLRPGSVTVRPGDIVRTGQLLGEVGNSGNTTEPHLHLHAERDGVGLDLSFTDVPGRLYRGRTIRR
ncbi:M23 family metallopeptidase [Streptomyces acidiscabies]|uniref:M23 family metallopeptidase n=1 Tax=Streptomyces acidiscabies TaxID=42234 RepID=UPI0009532503|nr:M23 family metallopeptidase [Streptomyces acidiscabies]